MTETVAVIGLIAAVNLVATFALALYVRRQHEKIRHLTSIVLTLSEKRKDETGERIAIDKGLLIGEPADVIAADGDDWSQARPPMPWVLK